ncbi:cartilage oligomeric matrix protein [Cimex lectularius]|uniref:Thrombospondin n=1 Tax=Cimex lectularius TaxID=79782 RepID=A0A8I6S283_CIMLE|nr:cartilage oligomeric matrix protein [Cimex lectularius]
MWWLHCVMLLFLAGLASPASLDTEMAAALEESLESDTIVLSIRHLRPKRRKNKIGVETLLLVSSSNEKLQLKLDREDKKVIVETLDEKKHFNLPSIVQEKVIDSLVFLIDLKKDESDITLYANCIMEGKVTLSQSLKKMFHTKSKLQVYRDRRNIIDLDSDTKVQEVLNRLKCDLHDQMLANDATDMAEDYRPQIRGDIPIIHDCDENLLVETINKLINVVKRLEQEMQSMRTENQALRQLLEQCDVCRPASESHTRVTCNSDPAPCFPGVECRDTSDGPTCGRCPSGYVGNGFECKPGISCDQSPCYPGVRCYDSVDGFQCGSCPHGYTGNGQHCKQQRYGCEYNPCSRGVDCQNTNEPPYYRCGSCPDGYTGNGTNCHDLDECDLAEPCDPRVQCTNLNPGYRCGPCPVGFTGSSGVIGVGLEYAVRNRQQCYDINECDDGRNGGCTQNSICQNTEGSFTCGPCLSGFVGNQTHGCRSMPGLCPDGTHCDPNAQCYRIGLDRYGCKCNIGWAGDGFICGVDTDLDRWPDYDVGCSHGRCRKDNCPHIPNSGQEDADGDQMGDVCDDDADNDGISNEPDNCPLVPNPDQLDTDQDGADKSGNECDNCPTVPNVNQEDVDKDGIGDACDPDMDNDGILNNQDNCPRISNPDQRDQDSDGLGDVCDNCPRIPNTNQEDSDFDNIGNVCDNDIDRDRDGIQDSSDNCPKISNSDQLDKDGDGRGDECDHDADGDGVSNNNDNCRLVYNPDQEDLNGNGVGDECEDDFDGDGVINHMDNCPNNSKIFQTDFRTFQTVALDPEGETQIDPHWIIYDEGAEIVQTMNSDPGLALGYDAFSGVDFEGTIFVDTNVDDDYIGFIFSYQNSHKFYTVMWKKKGQTYWQATPFRAVAEPGIQLKLVNSISGPGRMLRNSLWQTGNTQDQVKLLWKDPRNVGWKENTAYRWLLIHRPKISLIRLIIYEGKRIVADSGNIFDSTLKGGRLGVLSFSQEKVIWADLVYRCNENIPQEIYDELSPRLKQEINVDSGSLWFQHAK